MTFDPAPIAGSFAVVEPHGTKITHYFYEHLFANNPDVRGLFARHMEEQEDRLWNALGVLVANLQDTEMVIRMLRSLGARHVGYGALPEHFPAVGASLLATLKHFAGEAWTPEAEQSWTALYEVITSTMGEAMAAAAADRTEPTPGG
ncbi:globin domain-containing protein [Streptomyces sp. NRRL S-813]|uniref:globin domain-containing protein n=1 Tax=Streptomyces sp. NRRL S-813 TaxID=1463919 RepID=UPI00068A4D16|nr:globin domain-containing protein [Streptomyces sp. NRRL S-813]